MARVAELFHLMDPLLLFRLVVRHAAIDQQEETTRHEHTRSFVNERFRGREVVRRDAAGHQVEGGIRVREIFCRVLPRLHLQTALLSRGFCTIEHCLGEIGKGDVMPQGGKVQAGMTTAGGNIEHPSSWGKRDMGKRGFHVADIREDIMIGAVTLTLPGELRLSGELDCI